MNFLRKVINIISRVLMIAVALCLAAMIIIAFIEVVRRYFFHKSFAWSDELVRYLMIAVGFLGGAALFKSKGLVALDLLTGHFSERWKTVIILVNNTVILMFLIALFRFSMVNIQATTVAKQISIGLGCSMAIPFSVVPIGLFLMIIFALENYFEVIAPLLKKEGGI